MSHRGATKAGRGFQRNGAQLGMVLVLGLSPLAQAIATVQLPVIKVAGDDTSGEVTPPGVTAIGKLPLKLRETPQSVSVIDHERIQTTEAKAKAVKPELERLITLAKKGDHHSRRLAMARLGQDKFVVYKLFEEIAPRYADRPGGYTRIVKLGPRRSDSTEMVFLELV